MAKDLFNRYIWLVDTVQQADGITFKEINERWKRSSLGDGEDLPLKTFNNHREEIEKIFDISIVCRRKGGYKYYVENGDDIQKGGVRSWLLNTFAVNNLINESHHMKRKILFEQIPSGQLFLGPIIRAMRENRTLQMSYRRFAGEDSETFTLEVEPYFVKIFKQRWYMIARNVEKGVLRIFGLDRIQSLQENGKTFDYPKDFEPEEYFCNSFGIFVSDDCPATLIELKVYGNQTQYLRSLPLHHSQKETQTTPEYSVFQYFMSPTYDLVQEILSHGRDWEVLSPRSLRDEIKAHAEEIVRRG